ncbi:MAG: FAD-dependent oxidoreductase [Candidatus Paceibacterota bacterium]
MIYDVIIVGAGPAGITSAIYTARNNLNTLVLGGNIGGLLFNKAVNIENYPGFPSISGIELAFKFKEHLETLENTLIKEEVVLNILQQNNLFKVKTEKNEFQGKTVIVTAGTKLRALNVKGEKEFLGKGVGYCPVCDGPFFKGKDVAIIGGGNAAFEAGIFLSSIAKSIFILERGNSFLADKKNQEKVKEFENIRTYTNAELLEIKGNDFVSSIKWKHRSHTLETRLQAVFIQIGCVPETSFVQNLVDLNQKGEIIVNEDMQTKTKGLFAGGDVTNSKVKQIICAASSGAIAGLSAYNYLLNYEN